MSTQDFENFISNHFDGLEKPAIISIGLENRENLLNVVNTLRKNGIDAVPYFSKDAENADKFIVSETGIQSPYLSPSDAFKSTQDIYNILHENNIKIRGHALPKTEENILYSVPSSNIENGVINIALNMQSIYGYSINSDKVDSFISDILEQTHQMESVPISELDKEKAIWRGGTLGDNSYGIISKNVSRDVCYGSPFVKIGKNYANGEYSGGVRYKKQQKSYGFLYQFEQNETQKYYHAYGIEHAHTNPFNGENKTVKDDNPKYETPIFPHRNKLKACYLVYGGDIFKIADTNGYISKEWEYFSKLHQACTTGNTYLSNRNNKLKRDLETGCGQIVPYNKKANLAEYTPIELSANTLESFFHSGDIIRTPGHPTEIKNANINSIGIGNLNDIIFSDSVKLSNVSFSIETKRLDFSKCSNIVSLTNCDLSDVEELILPTNCNYLYLENVKLPKNMKHLDVSKVKENTVFFNMDLSSVNKFKFDKEKTKFWGNNTLPKNTQTLFILSQQKQRLP